MSNEFLGLRNVRQLISNGEGQELVNMLGKQHPQEDPEGEARLGILYILFHFLKII